MEDGPAATIASFEDACQNAVVVQRTLLSEILQKNKSCEYLQRYGAPLDLETFRSQVPVVSYDDICQDIQRVADGDNQPILCSDPIVRFSRSSGTSSGKHKLIPQTGDPDGYAQQVHHTSLAYRNKYFPLDSRGPLSMSFLFSIELKKTKSGLPFGNATSNFYKSENFKHHPIQRTSPYELIVAGSDWKQTAYCHLLCGLLKRDQVGMIQSLFAFTLCEVLKVLQREWKNLCEDMSTGILNTNLVSDERLRSIMSEVLQQELENQDSRELVNAISTICSAESWDGIIPLLWPRAKYIHTIVTGAMQPSVPTLRRYSGGVPLVGDDYVSSEALILAINTNPTAPPEDLVFTLPPSAVFFEFIPVDEGERSIVGVEGVEAGKQYELVLTTPRGLYRYKMGDVIKIVDYFHEAPQIAFCYRTNAVLSIAGERVDEQELQKVVMSSTLNNVEVKNFTSYADFKSEETPHYVIFCELRDTGDYSKHDALQDACEKMDKSFHNLMYLMGREKKSIGPLELVLLKQGTFEKLMQKAVEDGASPGQYKTPRCVTTPTMLELLKLETCRSYRCSSDNIPASLIEDLLEPSFPEKPI